MQAPFDVSVPNVPDPQLGPLLTKIAEAGFPAPVVTPVGETGQGPVATALEDDLPISWEPVQELKDVYYRWPEVTEHYTRYVIYTGTTRREGSLRIALGHAERANTWGRDRLYVVAFLSGAQPQIPLCEWLETDDFETSHEFIAVVRGSDGGRKMYGPGDTLPNVYTDHFETVIYRDRIDYSGAWNKVAVVAKDEDYSSMLNHALLQARRRGDL
jgi:hypothetical protein